MSDDARLALENVLRHLYEQQRDYVRAQRSVASELAAAQHLAITIGATLARVSTFQLELHDLRRAVANTILGLQNTQQTLEHFSHQVTTSQSIVMDALGIVRERRNTDDVDTNPGTPIARAKEEEPA